MTVVNKFNINKQQVTLDADIIKNMSANDVSYNDSFQYDENTVGGKLSELDSEVDSKAASLELMSGIGKGYIEGYYIGGNNVWEVIDSSFLIISVNPSDEIILDSKTFRRITEEDIINFLNNKQGYSNI